MYAALSVRAGDRELYAHKVVVSDSMVIVHKDDPEDEGSTAVDMGTETFDAARVVVTIEANW